ncbi:MAG TPA: GNAT family N-acetyltransferase [Caulobacteraceae bacterium]
MAQAQADIAAIIDAIAHKMAVEQGVEVVRVPGAVGLRYREPLPHPWPRAVELSVEILAADLASAAKAGAQILADRHETHRTSVFGCDVYADGEAIAAAGYDGCWNTALLAADLAQAPRTRVSDLAVERVERADQVAELNALDPEFLSHAAGLGRPDFIDLLGRRAGRAVAKGQIVCLAGQAAYVADMFTHPVARNAGYAGAILSALHDEAAARGAWRAVLIPSQAAAESRFYEKRGYSLVCPRAVLLSKA